jgi:hypothetical protein
MVFDLIRLVHDSFPQHFTSLECEQVEVQSFSHFDLAESVTQYLSRFAMKDHLAAFKSVGSFIEEPCWRSSVTAADQSWSSRLAIERSLAISNGIYFDLSTRLRAASWELPFDQKLLLMRKIGNAWLEALNLESADVIV